MARVAEEPTPSPSRVFARSLRHLALRDAVAAMAAAWRLAFEPEGRVGASTRATAAALFLSVVILFGVGGAVILHGAVALVGSDGSPAGPVAPGAVSSSSPVPAVELAPSPSISPTPPPTAPPTPRPKATPRATPAPATSSEDGSGERVKRETPEPVRRETPEPEDRSERREQKAEDKDEKDD